MVGKTRRSLREIRLAPEGLFNIEYMLAQGGMASGVWLATYKANGELLTYSWMRSNLPAAACAGDGLSIQVVLTAVRVFCSRA